MLRKIDLSNRAVHLLYLDDALANHERREVVSHLRADTFREFKVWATGREARAESLVPNVSMSFREGTLYADDTPIMTMEDEADDVYREPIAEVLRGAFRAWKGKCLAHVVPVYDSGEARAVDNFLKKLRAQK